MEKLKVFGVIPSRLKSTRFPNKPLAKIAGKSMIKRVVENCLKSKMLTELIVATDSVEIANELSNENLQVIMTDPNLPSGTDRVYSAIKNRKPDIVINIQGDEPLIHPEAIDHIVNGFVSTVEIDMVTLGQDIIELSELNSLNNVKVICNQKSEAIYFSRFPIPFSRGLNQKLDFPLTACMKHIGIYGYQFAFLERFCKADPVELELHENLEQLRALYLGAKIKVLKTNHFFHGVDVPEDIQKVEKQLKQLGLQN